MEILDILLSENFWAAALRIATPLIFGVLGVLICEKSGVLNLGIEGIFAAGAMAGWMAVWLGADLWSGLFFAALTGAFFGLIHAILTVPLGSSLYTSDAADDPLGVILVGPRNNQKKTYTPINENTNIPLPQQLYKKISQPNTKTQTSVDNLLL